MTRMTVTPTGSQTFEPANVIPPFADVICDCRALPGQTEADIREHVERALGDGFRYELELLEPLEGGTESPIDTPLYRACEEYVADRVPGRDAVSVHRHRLHRLALGARDPRHGRLRVRPGLHGEVEAYLDAAHAADEALEVDDLVEMTEFHLEAIAALAGSDRRP